MERKTRRDLTEVSLLVTTALGNVLSDFLTDRDISGARPATLTYYRNELSIFTRWAEDAGARELSDITPDLLRAYLASLRERRNRNGIHKNFTALKTWLNWAWGEYDMPTACPISKLKVAPPENVQQPAIELDAFTRLLDACKGRNAKRDKAILLFLLDTGIRRRELCALRVSALRKAGTVQLDTEGTKTGEARAAFLSRDTQKALRAYLNERSGLEAAAPLFATQEGGAFSVSGLRQVVRRRCKAAGIPETGLHAFRRAFAIESLRAGADVVSVSRLLGHKKVETTKRYLPQTDDDLRAVHDKTSPVARLKKRGKSW